jgi:benzoate/toluate 1,2-dioxygenase beta subunit
MANRAEMKAAPETDQESRPRKIERWQGASPTDASIYDDLIGSMETLRTGGPMESARIRELEAVLFAEARLLDERRYRDWLGMLTEDFIYWVPANHEGTDPRKEHSTNFDDLRRITDRIALTETGSLYAQIPPSRTCRIISNVEVWSDTDDSALVRSNFVIWEHRRGKTNFFAGWHRHKLVRQNGRWLIRQKTINLINAEDPLGNITFVL